MIKHCISTFNKKTEEKFYRTYITDIIRAIALVEYRGQADFPRYSDAISKQVQDDTPAEQKAEDIKGRISDKLRQLEN